MDSGQRGAVITQIHVLGHVFSDHFRKGSREIHGKLGHAVPLFELHRQLLDLRGGDRVERAGGLVHQQHVRLHGQRPRDAQPLLLTARQAQVQSLLAVEDHSTLSDIASWADRLREHDPDLGRRSARWHYVNLARLGLPEEQNCQYRAAEHCADGNCVVAAIEEQGRLLADTAASPQQRLQALKFVVHFVGDVHQPMHAGYGHDRKPL